MDVGKHAQEQGAWYACTGICEVYEENVEGSGGWNVAVWLVEFIVKLYRVLQE